MAILHSFSREDLFVFGDTVGSKFQALQVYAREVFCSGS